jgi:hypothetical protein
MPAHTHTRSHAKASGSVDARLPWWALALPVIAFIFIVLLLLIADQTQAHAAGGDPSVGQLLHRIQQTPPR